MHEGMQVQQMLCHGHTPTSTPATLYLHIVVIGSSTKVFADSLFFPNALSPYKMCVVVPRHTWCCLYTFQVHYVGLNSPQTDLRSPYVSLSRPRQPLDRPWTNLGNLQGQPLSDHQLAYNYPLGNLSTLKQPLFKPRQSLSSPISSSQALDNIYVGFRQPLCSPQVALM